MELFYIFANLFNLWFNSRRLDPAFSLLLYVCLVELVTQICS